MSGGTSRKRKILFVLPVLSGGGAERIIIHIIRGLDRSRYVPSLLVIESSGSMRDEIPPDVDIIQLGERRHYRLDVFRIILRMAHVIKQRAPDMVFSAVNVANFPAIVAARLAGRPVMAYEMSHPALDIQHEHRFPAISSALLHLTYRFAVKIIALSKGIAQSLAHDFGVDESKIEVSYTPFDPEFITNRAAMGASHPFFDEGMPCVIAVGGLYRLKGIDLLVRAMATVNQNTPVGLILLGRGPEEAVLKTLAADLGIADRVSFLGFDENPWKYLARCTMLAMPSRHEGFGNVIVEAMICGVPVIASDCPVGPKEILNHGEFGVVFQSEDPDSLASGILRLIGEPGLRAELVRKGHERTRDFEKRKVIRRLECIIESAFDLRNPR